MIEEYRRQITATDRVLLAAMNQRIELVRALHDHKEEQGVPLRDPVREDALVRELQLENTGPLTNDGLAELFHFVIELTRKEIHGA